jgi:hypothetical protein
MTSKNQKLNKYRHSYQVTINSHPRPSWVNAMVTDTKNNRTATADFHLYTRRGRMLYAEVAVTEVDRWVGEDIDTISPVVCEAAMKYFDVVLYEA